MISLKTSEIDVYIEGLCSRVYMLLSGIDGLSVSVRTLDMLTTVLLTIVESFDFTHSPFDGNHCCSMEEHSRNRKSFLSLLSKTLFLTHQLCIHPYNKCSVSSFVFSLSRGNQLLKSVKSMFEQIQEDWMWMFTLLWSSSSAIALWLDEPKPSSSAIAAAIATTTSTEALTDTGQEEVFQELITGEDLKKSVDNLWDTILSCLHRCYKGSYDSDLLCRFAPLLEVALSNRYRHIKNASLQFWNETFGEASALDYPDSLIDIFKSLRYKEINIRLPSWEKYSSFRAGSQNILEEVSTGNNRKDLESEFFLKNSVFGDDLHKRTIPKEDTIENIQFSLPIVAKEKRYTDEDRMSDIIDSELSELKMTFFKRPRFVESNSIEKSETKSENEEKRRQNSDTCNEASVKEWNLLERLETVEENTLNSLSIGQLLDTQRALNQLAVRCGDLLKARLQ